MLLESLTLSGVVLLAWNWLTRLYDKESLHETAWVYIRLGCGSEHLPRQVPARELRPDQSHL